MPSTKLDLNKIAVIIPAPNEEKYIRKCLDSVRSAEDHSNTPVEIVVALNRCIDNSENIAKEYGTVTVVREMRCKTK